ncbi:glutathione-S-transferase/glutaredoxin [Trypanosoma theileri]|uniref:Glutathione-S-transferase/glutaredoxin n=1 Tax=Trypanosoma theileri TaxID=67003 RepID=A0A1X0NTT0_9TRYP|nr:glutathione-S-transferase/glutaredoxin [Trypanosoma theileri]ORC87520.1 glutathione-S-transferase/glutaredoxin [Trypanosoma theileri]
MRFGSRRLYITLAGGGIIGGTAYWYGTCRNRANSTAPRQLSADEFNALQDKDLLTEAFRATHLPWSGSTQRNGQHHKGQDFSMTLYRLLGCPYCAKVEWVLRYHCVPFEIVNVDTLSGEGIPDSRYTLVPQIRLTRMEDSSHPVSGEDGEGVYVVDSQKIISSLSVPLGFAEQLENQRVLETRQWITERFQAVSFVVTNGTWRDAFASYPYVTPTRYHNIFFHVFGASVLCVLSKYKIQPSLKSQKSDMSEAPPKDTHVWLRKELEFFSSRLQDDPSQKFHGGKEPDIADVEMYAVTRIIDAHPRLRNILHEGDIGEWNAAMDDVMQRRIAKNA